MKSSITTNLLKETWTELDSFELRLLLAERIGRPGQYDDRSTNPNTFYLPLARAACRIALTFRGKQVAAIEPGPAFDRAEWARISEEIEQSILAGTQKVGREYSFSSLRVTGSWRGKRSGVQILPPPDDAPRADSEVADHPFILEFPITASDFQPVTNHRRMCEHRNLTLLLNVLLAGHTRFQLPHSEHFWARVPHEDNHFAMEWVQQCFLAKLGETVSDELSPPAGERAEEMEPEKYYEEVGHDGKGFRVPADLDELIGLYQGLSPAKRAKFDRAAFWLDMASRQWTISVSLSFTSLVSAVESFTGRGTAHRVYCDECKDYVTHDVPGATESFRAFFEKYAPGASLRSRRTHMYRLRSGITHGSDLMQLDQDLAFGWAPPEWNERELHQELWGLTRVAMRNWLRAAAMAEVPGGEPPVD